MMEIEVWWIKAGQKRSFFRCEFNLNNEYLIKD